VLALESQLQTNEAQSSSGIKDLEVQLERQRNSIATQTRALTEARLLAPVAGEIVEVGFRVGELTQGAVRIMRQGSLVLEAHLPESDALEVRPGMRATVELDAFPGRVLTATVRTLATTAETETASGTTSVAVSLKLDPAQSLTRIKSGLSGTVRIQVLSIPNAVVVPLEALVEEASGGTGVWLARSGQTGAMKKAVRVLGRSFTEAAIAGVSAGEILISLPPEGMVNGQSLSFNEPTSTVP
jgi:HlyD family secretion protein